MKLSKGGLECPRHASQADDEPIQGLVQDVVSRDEQREREELDEAPGKTHCSRVTTAAVDVVGDDVSEAGAGACADDVVVAAVLAQGCVREHVAVVDESKRHREEQGGSAARALSRMSTLALACPHP